MPDAKQPCPDRATQTTRATARPADVAGPGETDTDARRLATVRRIAVSRRAGQAALAAAVRDLRSHGRMDYVR